MGYQIIRQPGEEETFAILCSYTDTIIVWDASEAEIVEWFVDLAAERARVDAQRTIDHVKAGEPRRAYFQFTKTWERALEIDREHGGEAWQEFTEHLSHPERSET